MENGGVGGGTVHVSRSRLNNYLIYLSVRLKSSPFIARLISRALIALPCHFKDVTFTALLSTISRLNKIIQTLSSRTSIRDLMFITARL